MNEQIRILIADDHPIVRRGISMCLSHQTHIQVVGEAADGREALVKVRELKPDVVLMDIDMPQMNGMAVTDLLRREMPSVKVIILSTCSSNQVRHAYHRVRGLRVCFEGSAAAGSSAGN